MPFWRLYYHFVWATKEREPLIATAIEDHLYGVLASKASEKGALVFAANGMPDHVHLVAAVPPSISISDFVQHIKGASSYVMQREYNLPFGWQRGYGVFSLGERNLATAVGYVERQKEHHAEGTVIALLERSQEHDDGSVVTPNRSSPGE